MKRKIIKNSYFNLSLSSKRFLRSVFGKIKIGAHVYLKLLFLTFFLFNFINCSKGGKLISGPLSSDHQTASQKNNSNGDDQNETNDPNGGSGGQEETNNGVPGGQDGTSDGNQNDGTNDPNGVPGGQDGTNNPNEHSYQFSITQSVHEQKEVDILMVIDNSGSMSANHKNLGKRFGNLFNNNLQRVDWQMAFISSCFGVYGNSEIFYDLKGISDIHHVLSPQLDNPENIFRNTISSKQGGGCSTTEFKGILNMINSSETHPEGFFRSDALLAVVIVTDEKDNTGIRALDIITAVQNNFGQFKPFITYGLIVEPGDVVCDRQEPDVHYKVDDLVQKTGGITGSICATDYSPIMADIGTHIERTLAYSEVSLRHESIVEDTVSLSCSQLQNTIICPFWELDSQANKIVFDTPPAEGVTVQISYRYQSE